MEYIPLILLAVGTHLVALVMPGPDFIMTIKNSLMYSRRAGIWTGVGFSLGIFVHILYCIAGIGLIISQSILAFNTIKILGGLYLIYLGVLSWRNTTKFSNISIEKEKKDLHAWKAIHMGFWTNILNPKVTLFFVSLFSVVITPQTPSWVILTLSLIMMANMIIWFSLVSILFTTQKFQSWYLRTQHWIDRVFGIVLVGIGLKVITSEK